jgi:hypothetical protein
MPGRADCPARGPRGTVDALACARPRGASRGANELGPSGSGAGLGPARVPSWLGGGACGWWSGMPPPSGQIPPSWAWWEIEAPTARAARGPSQAQPVRLSTSWRRGVRTCWAGRWNSAPEGLCGSTTVRTGRRGRPIPFDHLPVATEGGNAGSGLDGAQIARSPCRRCALWCRSRAGAGMPRQRQSPPCSPPARSLHPDAVGERGSHREGRLRPVPGALGRQ